jgi:hypothetical protein
VARDIDETIIIEIAAENPPRKTITVNTLLSNWGINRNRCLNYGLCLQKNIAPAIGKTKGWKVAGTTEKPNGCSDVGFFIVLDNRSVELSWQGK